MRVQVILTRCRVRAFDDENCGVTDRDIGPEDDRVVDGDDFEVAAVHQQGAQTQGERLARERPHDGQDRGLAAPSPPIAHHRNCAWSTGSRPIGHWIRKRF